MVDSGSGNDVGRHLTLRLTAARFMPSMILVIEPAESNVAEVSKHARRSAQAGHSCKFGRNIHIAYPHCLWLTLPERQRVGPPAFPGAANYRTGGAPKLHVVTREPTYLLNLSMTCPLNCGSGPLV